MKSITEELTRLEIAVIEDALAMPTPLVTVYPREVAHRTAAEVLSSVLDKQVREDLRTRRAALKASLCTCGDDPRNGCANCPPVRAVRAR